MRSVAHLDLGLQEYQRSPETTMLERVTRLADLSPTEDNQRSTNERSATHHLTIIHPNALDSVVQTECPVVRCAQLSSSGLSFMLT